VGGLDECCDGGVEGGHFRELLGLGHGWARFGERD
jgi:hypothetical protein